MRAAVTPAMDMSPRPGGTSPLSMDAVTTPPGEGLEDAVERDREGEQIAAVNAAVVELVREVAEQPRPVLALGSRWYRYFHSSLDELDGAPARSGRSGLLPCPLPAGRRTPLRQSTSRLDGDRPAAPPARRRGQPPGLPGGVDRWRRTCLTDTGWRSARPRRQLAPSCDAPRRGPTRRAASSAHARDGPDGCPRRRHPDASRRNREALCMRCVGWGSC